MKMIANPSQQARESSDPKTGRILVIARPFFEMRGRGIERYTRNLILGLRLKRCSVDFLAEYPYLTRMIQPYGSPLSPLVYDIFAPIIKLSCIPTKYNIAHMADVAPGILAAAVRKRISRLIVTCHDLYGVATPGYIEEHETARGKLYQNFFKRTVGTAFKYADRIIADTSQTADEIHKTFGLRGKVRVVNPAIDPKFKQMSNLIEKRSRNHISLGYVGALSVSRRLDRALRILKLAVDRGLNVKLMICGRGPMKSWLAAMARRLNVDSSVEFREAVPEDRMVELYNSFDILLHPALYEGFGYTILEAHACGLPVVIFKDAFISPEVSRFAIRVADEEEALLEIERLLHNVDYYRQISEDSKMYASSFTLSMMTEQILQVYRELE